jgi:hypothetical protein
MSECESISGSEIAKCDNWENESVMDIEIPINAGWELSSSNSEEDHYIRTIPLHPYLRCGKKHLITEENVDTIEQTKESAWLTVEDWGPSIVYVKDEFITYELCKRAIERHSGAICSIKPHLLTEDEYYKLCLQSVTENGWNTKYTPKEIQTQEFVDAAIESICWAIQFCEDKFKTYENCLSAVSRNGQTMEFVPKNLIDKDICIAAAKSRYPCVNLIPMEFLTREMCEMAVRADGENIRYVPDEFMSTELAWLAIKSPAPSNPSADMAGGNIRYIPGRFLTKELIVESARLWYCTYGLIPKEFITEEIEEAVLEVSPYCIRYMKQTPERCIKALKKCSYVLGDCIEQENITGDVVEYIETLPDKIKNSVMRMCSDEKIKHITSLIKDKPIPTREEILENCRVMYWRYHEIPDEILTDELKKDILKVSPYCIRYMEQTPENCWIAIKRQPLVAEESIEKENITREMAEYILGLSDEIKEQFMDDDLHYFKSLLQSA